MRNYNHLTQFEHGNCLDFIKKQEKVKKVRKEEVVTLQSAINNGQ